MQVMLCILGDGMMAKQSRFQIGILRIAVSAVMTALVCVATIVVQIPNPATRGYINIGDAMIFVSALTFGTFVGGIAGGVGSALADVMSGYGLYAPFTLVIKGLEGVLAGLVTNKRSMTRDVLAVAIAGCEMIFGYFLSEFHLLQFGWAALTEVPGNMFQIVAGGIIAIPVASVLRRRLPGALK